MNRNSKTFKIALGGICLALTLIFIFGATIVPGVELTLYAISSLFTAVMILETGGCGSVRDGRNVGTGESGRGTGELGRGVGGSGRGVGAAVLMYAGASLLGLVLIPNKPALVPYIAMFGYYPILKFFIEKINSGLGQISLKVIYFAAVISLGLLAFRSVIAQSISIPDYPAAILIAAGTALMILYDYILTFLIGWYIRRFKTGNSSDFRLS